jgi:hypothetical protein
VPGFPPGTAAPDAVQHCASAAGTMHHYTAHTAFPAMSCWYLLKSLYTNRTVETAKCNSFSKFFPKIFSSMEALLSRCDFFAIIFLGFYCFSEKGRIPNDSHLHSDHRE